MSTRPQHVYKAMLEFSNSCGMVCVCVCVYVCVKERATNDAFLWCTCWECVVNVNACGLGGCVFVWDRFVVVINNKEEWHVLNCVKCLKFATFFCLFVCLFALRSLHLPPLLRDLQSAVTVRSFAFQVSLLIIKRELLRQVSESSQTKHKHMNLHSLS